MHNIIAAIYFMLPACFANAAPVAAFHLPFLRNFSRPIDFGITINAKRIFGDNKTFRGVAAAIFVAFVTILLQKYVTGPLFFSGYELIDYDIQAIYFYGCVFGCGAVFGDLFGSFVKRRLGLSPGTWLPYFDHVDYVIGVLALLWIFSLLPPLSVVLIALFLIPFITFIAAFISVKFGIKTSL